jgi:hypothetical protein
VTLVNAKRRPVPVPGHSSLEEDAGTFLCLSALQSLQPQGTPARKTEQKLLSSRFGEFLLYIRQWLIANSPVVATTPL